MMDLYESLIEGEDLSMVEKRALLNTLKKQALHNYQIGLREEIQNIIRSRVHKSLQDAVAAATAEERVKCPTASRANANKNRNEQSMARSAKTSTQCFKCGKTEHFRRDCRSNK